jgi:hypothetical protein
LIRLGGGDEYVASTPAISIMEGDRGMKKRIIVLGAVVASVVMAVAVAATSGPEPDASSAADHLDAPGLTPPGGKTALDITDVYAFRAGDGQTVLAVNVNGFTDAGEQALFASGAPGVRSTRRVAYWLRVDNDGDAIADVNLRLRFGKANDRGVQEFTLARNGRPVVEGRSSAFGGTRINRARGYTVFAGMRDDPFFFDLQGFIDILSTEPGESFIGCSGSRPDAFAGTNVSSIVLKLPAGKLRGDTSDIGVWATTTMGGRQIDRMGRPAIATVFIPNNPFPGERTGEEESMKNSFNGSRPANDVNRWRGEVVDTLTTLHSLNDGSGDDPSDDPAKIEGLANTLLPDVLTFDTSSASGFLNGRRLADDVIDAELGLVTEGAVTTDCVSANDKPFRQSFPYLAGPHR